MEISVGKLLIVLLLVVLIFGTKRLTNIGSDIGNAIKNFKKSMNDDELEQQTEQTEKEDAEFTAVSDESKQKTPEDK